MIDKIIKPAGYMCLRALFSTLIFACFSGCISVPVKPPPRITVTLLKVRTVPTTSMIVFSGNVRVRLIGVKAPESPLLSNKGHPFYNEAVRRMLRFMSDKGMMISKRFSRRKKGRGVIIELGKKSEDIVGNKLAYVYFLKKDPATGILTKLLLNAYVLRQGWGTFKPDRANSLRDAEMLEAEQYARSNKLGIWEK